MTYDGNPDGKPIYPNEIDHGYDQSIRGDSGVMQQLVKNLRHEQGQRVASSTRVSLLHLRAKARAKRAT